MAVLGLPGISKWMRVQYEEELGHALKFFGFVNERGGKVTLQAIDQPTTDFDSPLAVFQQALEHEQKVTGDDYPAQVLLQWYINEQVEEEKNATNIVEQLKLIGKNSSALLILDREPGTRKQGATTPMSADAT